MIATILSAFLPVFAVIALGYGVRASGYLPGEFWRGVNALNHRLLLPAFLIAFLASADLSHPDAGRLALISALVSLVLLAIGLAAGKILTRGPAFAPVTAVAVQWNFVLTLALVTRLAGEDAASLTAAVVAPGVLIGAVTTVGCYALAGGAPPGRALGRVIRDPMVIASGLGLAANFAGFERLPVLPETVALVGGGALAVILLAMGAGLDFKALQGRLAPLAAGAAVRCLAGPVAALAFAALFGLTGDAALALVIAGAAPSAAFVYAVAADFEVETGLTAGLITLTVLVSAAVSPLAAFLALAL